MHQPDPARDLIDAAVEDVARTQRRRAEIVAAERAPKGQRAALIALIAAFLVLGVLFVTNIQGRSLLALLAPAPPPAVARQQAEGALQLVVNEIESFRRDYAELPGSLAEVGTPLDGEWTYARRSGTHYQVALRFYGQVVTFDSLDK